MVSDTMITDLITPFTKVSGTLAKPMLRVDAGRTGKEVLKADEEMKALQQ
jgi:hypothetical protein